MNICLITREYPSDHHTGGIGTYTENAARALARLGQSVTVITEAARAPSVTAEDGVRVIRLATPRARRMRMAARAWSVFLAVAKLPSRPDIVQACEFGAEAVFLALHRRQPTKLITRLATPSFMVHGLNAHAQAGESLSRHYIGTLERIQTRRSDAIFSVSDALADVVCARWRIPRDRVRTIPNGVDLAERCAGAATDVPDEVRGKPYLIYVGRLEERKGVHVLAEALPAVLERYPHLHAVFAGNNAVTYKGQSLQAYVETCNRPYRDRLHFFPRLSHRALYPLLRNALVAVAPSLWEAFGNVCVEALDAGIPVVASSGSGFAEQIEDGRSGLLVPPGDVGALRDALRAVVDDPDARQRMAAAAKRRAADFRLDRRTQQLLSFYEDVMGRLAASMAQAAS